MGVAAAETIIAWQSHEGPRVARAKGYDIIFCTLCGFCHVVPLPEPEVLERNFREARDEKPVPPAHSGEDQDWAELGLGDRLDNCARLLGPGRRRLLDIGAGSGIFLQFAKGLGWNGLGIEASRPAAAQARSLGLTVREGLFNRQMAEGLGRFDAIHLNGVLEHVPNPTEVLILARELLDEDGVICACVPNDFSPFQIAAADSLRIPDWWIAPPRHLNYFDFASLSALLERLDFEIAARTTSFPMEAFLLMGENYTADPAVGHACHTKRKHFDLALEHSGFKETRRAFYRALAEAGFGREAIVIAQKL